LFVTGAAVRVQELRVQAIGRPQLHLRQQADARHRRDQAHQPGRGVRPDAASHRGAPLSQVQSERGGVLPGADQEGRGRDEVVLRVHQPQVPQQVDRVIGCTFCCCTHHILL
jgi:hypothetical protein